MPKYLALCKYSQASMKGLLKETPTAREKFVRSMYEANGATVESLHWMVGGEYTIAMVVSCTTAVGVALTTAVLASGALSDVRISEVLSSAEMDKALAHQVEYRAPGA